MDKAAGKDLAAAAVAQKGEEAEREGQAAPGPFGAEVPAAPGAVRAAGVVVAAVGAAQVQLGYRRP